MLQGSSRKNFIAKPAVWRSADAGELKHFLPYPPMRHDPL